MQEEEAFNLARQKKAEPVITQITEIIPEE
jgi:hypothetical protein